MTVFGTELNKPYLGSLIEGPLRLHIGPNSKCLGFRHTESHPFTQPPPRRRVRRLPECGRRAVPNEESLTPKSDTLLKVFMVKT